uniref:Uncharacterized protein n=1 Tax=uncultured marine virus TaxID=186617 RepID=S4TF35_9VIRU|nr:hypothetical protein [uncultured marine virus]
MATKKTSMFTLTERLTLSTAGTVTSATIDLGSYVDVGDRQALQIHSVDYVFQGLTAGTDLSTTFGADSEVQVQVMDLNRGGLVFANDRALVSSGRLIYDSAGSANQDADLYPDNYGKGADDGRYVVNDALYIEGLVSTLASNQAVNATVRVNASIVTLTQKDFMAIAIQSTAADN